jgi:hypothetical protein
MTTSPEDEAAPPFRMVVELGKVREFARATKSANPEYLTGDHPVAPATFLVTSGFWQDQPAPRQQSGGFGSYERLLHGAQEFVFPNGPPKAGTVLHVQARPGPSYEKTGRRGGVMKFRESVTEYRDESGTLVAEARGTIIETSQAPTKSADA